MTLLQDYRIKPGSTEDKIRIGIANTDRSTAEINLAVDFIHLMKEKEGKISTKFYKAGVVNTEEIFKQSEKFWKKRMVIVRYMNSKNSNIIEV